jgi:hypothetical protein
VPDFASDRPTIKGCCAITIIATSQSEELSYVTHAALCKYSSRDSSAAAVTSDPDEQLLQHWLFCYAASFCKVM